MRNTVAQNARGDGMEKAGNREGERARAVAAAARGQLGEKRARIAGAYSIYIYWGKEREDPLFAPLPAVSPRYPFSLQRATAAAAAPVLRFSTFSRFILTASSLNRFPGEIYGRAIIQEERARASCTQSAMV